MGVCQNAAFCPVGSRIVTWQVYSPGATAASGMSKRMGHGPEAVGHAGGDFQRRSFQCFRGSVEESDEWQQGARRLRPCSYACRYTNMFRLLLNTRVTLGISFSPFSATGLFASAASPFSLLRDRLRLSVHSLATQDDRTDGNISLTASLLRSCRAPDFSMYCWNIETLGREKSWLLNVQ